MNLNNIQESLSQSSQTPHSFKKKINKQVGLQYLMYVPESYSQSTESYPMIVFLHGAGERGDVLEKVTQQGLAKYLKDRKDFPFLVVSPQCPVNDRWTEHLDDLNGLIDRVEELYRVDSTRIYLTGNSMGGQGTWKLAIYSPHRFAAIAPICGKSYFWLAPTIKHIPAWVFHGEKDTTVPIWYSKVMVNSLKELKADVRLTIYPETAHDSWTKTYNNDELYRWLLSHQLKQ